MFILFSNNILKTSQEVKKKKKVFAFFYHMPHYTVFYYLSKLNLHCPFILEKQNKTKNKEGTTIIYIRQKVIIKLDWKLTHSDGSN